MLAIEGEEKNKGIHRICCMAVIGHMASGDLPRHRLLSPPKIYIGWTTIKQSDTKRIATCMILITYCSLRCQTLTYKDYNSLTISYALS